MWLCYEVSREYKNTVSWFIDESCYFLIIACAHTRVCEVPSWCRPLELSVCPLTPPCNSHPSINISFTRSVNLLEQFSTKILYSILAGSFVSISVVVLSLASSVSNTIFRVVPCDAPMFVVFVRCVGYCGTNRFVIKAFNFILRRHPRLRIRSPHTPQRHPTRYDKHNRKPPVARVIPHK